MISTLNGDFKEGADCCLPDGNFKLLLSIEKESVQFFIWLIKADQQNLLHIWELVKQKG